MTTTDPNQTQSIYCEVPDVVRMGNNAIILA